jgi:hypothetical protein
MCKYLVEMTDTFGGDANYSWLHSAVIDAPTDASSTMLVRRAKKALGVTQPHKPIDDWGDMIRLDLRHACVCIFISPL